MEAAQLNEALLERSEALNEVNQLTGEQHWHTVAPGTVVLFLDFHGNRVTPDGALAWVTAARTEAAACAATTHECSHALPHNQNKPMIGSRQWNLVAAALERPGLKTLVVVTDSPIIDAHMATSGPGGDLTLGSSPTVASLRVKPCTLTRASASHHNLTPLLSQSQPEAKSRPSPLTMDGVLGSDTRVWAVRQRQRAVDAKERLAVARVLANWKAGEVGRQVLVVCGGMMAPLASVLRCEWETTPDDGVAKQRKAGQEGNKADTIPSPAGAAQEAKEKADKEAASDGKGDDEEGGDGKHDDADADDGPTSVVVQFPQLCVGPMSGATRQLLGATAGHVPWYWDGPPTAGGDGDGDGGSGLALLPGSEEEGEAHSMALDAAASSASKPGVTFAHRVLPQASNFVVINIHRVGKPDEPDPAQLELHSWHGDASDLSDRTHDLVLDPVPEREPQSAVDARVATSTAATGEAGGDEASEAAAAAEAAARAQFGTRQEGGLSAISTVATGIPNLETFRRPRVSFPDEFVGDSDIPPSVRVGYVTAVTDSAPRVLLGPVIGKVCNARCTCVSSERTHSPTLLRSRVRGSGVGHHCCCHGGSRAACSRHLCAGR